MKDLVEAVLFHTYATERTTITDVSDMMPHARMHARQQMMPHARTHARAAAEASARTHLHTHALSSSSSPSHPNFPFFVPAQSDIETAALAVGNPSELSGILANHSEAGEARQAAVHVGFTKLPSAMRELKKEVVTLVEAEKLVLLKIVSPDPLEMTPTKSAYHEFFTASALTKGMALPPEAAEPWRWTQWWDPILDHGMPLGFDFIKGLHRACQARGGATLNLRARLSGSRATALKTVGLLVQAAGTIDLRDNRITDEEMLPIATRLESATKATKVTAAGNRLTVVGAKALATAAKACEARIQEVDLSRNRLGEGADKEEAYIAIADLSRKLGTMLLSGLNLTDETGGILATAFSKLPPLAEGSRTMLTKLDLHNNHLGASFASQLPCILQACPVLSALDLSKNSLGVAGGIAIAAALSTTTALKILDISNTNLCNCTPNVPTATRLEWSGEAVDALALAIVDATVGELHLGNNGLCGLWQENICGEIVVRGTYVATAIDSLCAMFDKDRIAIKREGLKFEDHNHVRLADSEKLVKLMKDNAAKPQRKDTPGLAGAQIIAPVPDIKKEAPKEKAPAVAADPIELDIAIGKQDAMAMRRKAAGGGTDGAAALKVLKSLESEKTTEEMTEEEIDAANWRARRDAELKIEEAHSESKEKQEKRAAERQQKEKGGAKDDEDNRPIVERMPESKGKKGKTERAPDKGDKGAKGGAKKKSDTGGGSGLTPRTAKTKGDSGGGTGLTPRTAKSGPEAAPTADEKSAAVADKGRTGYGQATGKGKKKKVVEAVVEEAPNPFSGAPLMIAMSNLIARTDVALNSPMVPNNPKVAAGALMRVSQTEELKDNARGKMQSEHRMYVALDGDQEALGWVTGVSKDEVEHLKLAGAGFPLMQVTKALNCREGKENDSKKLEDVPRRTLVRLMETETMADGTEKALIAGRCRRRAVGMGRRKKGGPGVAEHRPGAIAPHHIRPQGAHRDGALPRAQGAKGAN